MRVYTADQAPSNWDVRTIDSLCTRVTSGGTPSRRVPNYYGGPIPWIKTKELEDTWINATEESITDSGLANSSAKLLPTNTVLMAMYGATVGKLALLARPMACNQAACAMVFDDDEADYRYVFYQLLNARTQITDLANGAAQQNLSTGTIKALLIPMPPIDEQRGIAATLGALDDKIESNRRIVNITPRLVRTLMEQALGGGTRDVAVADLASFVNGGAYTKGASGRGRMVIRIAELNSGPGASTVYSEIDVPEEKTARQGDLLMSWSGSLGVYRWVLGEAIINQHIFKVLPSKSYPTWLVFDRLDQVMPVFQGIAKDKATTMGHIQRGHLESTVVEIPSVEAIRGLDDQLAPLWERLLAAEHETVKLTDLRDTLLPELMSGRIRVPEAAEVTSGLA